MQQAGDTEDSSSQSCLPSVERLTPILWDVIRTWHAHEAQLASWLDAELLLKRRQDCWEGLVERIQLINTFQWHEEDRSRDPRANDALLASVKRSIDASNARRVQAVEAFDSLLYREFTRAGCLTTSGPLPSETPGSIVDRLTVLALKIHHAGQALVATAAPDARSLEARLAILNEQMHDLGECLDRLVADVCAGRLRLKLYRQIKIYAHDDRPS